MRTPLLVDDHASVLETLTFVFTTRGYRTLVATSGRRACEIVESEVIDAALVDLHMPGIDGLKTCRALREITNRHGRVLCAWLMSAALTATAETQAREAGAVGALKKPFNVDAFLSAVEEACSPQQPVSPIAPSSHASAA